MKGLTIVALPAALVFCCCDSSTGPSDPGQGPGVAWFNGLGYTVDIFYPEDGTLVQGAFVTGEAPNDIVFVNGQLMAIVNSTSSSVSFVDPSRPGTVWKELSLQSGCNPYSACAGGNRLYVAALLSGSVFVIDLDSLEVVDEFPGVPNASGIALASGLLFVSSGNYPSSCEPGTRVLDPLTGSILDTIPTPENTHLLRYFPQTGMIHALSTTFEGDGAITIIDPSVPEIAGTVSTGGTPGLPCAFGDLFVAGDGWSSTSVFVYDEGSAYPEAVETGFGVTGVVATGDTLYMTSFASDAVLVMDGSTWTAIDTLQAGDGPQGILIIPE